MFLLTALKKINEGYYLDYAYPKRYTVGAKYELRETDVYRKWIEKEGGSGIRIYYTKQGETIILLLVGGDKSSQERDIKKAKTLVQELRGVKNGS